MSYCAWPRMAEIYRGVASGQIALVGWGAGSQLSRHHDTAPLPLRYLIDANPERAGQTFAGFDIRPPQALLGEDPAKVAVVVYPTRSFRNEIGAAIAALGPYDAITPFSAEIAHRFCLAMDRVQARGLTSKPKGSTRNGIVVQGAYDPLATPSVLRILATHYPDDRVVWSTWTDTPPPVLEAMRPWCDEIVFSPPPASPGNGNVNLQRQTTLAGLAWLADHGVRLAIKTRSDAAPLSRDLFASGEALLAALPAPAPGGGLRRRIIISNAYTYLHVPLHVSDIVQMGEVADLQALWSFPEDDGPLVDPAALDTQLLPVAGYARARLCGETHLGHRLAALRGLTVDYSLEQYLGIVRDSLIVIDQPWFDVFVPKYNATNYSLFIRTAERARDFIDFQAWMGLQGGDPAVLRNLIGDVDVTRTSLFELQFGAEAARARLAAPTGPR